MSGIEQDPLAAGRHPPFGFLKRPVSCADRLPGSPRHSGQRFVAGKLDDIRVDRGKGGRKFGGRQVGRHQHDLRCGRKSARELSEFRRARYLEGPRCSHDDVQADVVGTGMGRRQHTVFVTDAADLDCRRPVQRCDVCGHLTGGDEGSGGGAWIVRAHQRLTDECGVEAECPVSNDRGRVGDARLGDDKPIVRHERSQPLRSQRIDVERAQVAVVDANEPRLGRQGAHQFPLVVDLDERLQAEVEGLIDQRP